MNVKGKPTMSTAIEQRLDRMVQDLNEIRKEMILMKTRRSSVKAGKVDSWKSLGGMISARWDHVSAVDKINEQRNKL